MGVSPAADSLAENIKRMKELLIQIEGINEINLKGERLLIECSHDVTSEIARFVVNSGAGLSFLNKKEYGLNDIYYRYFEGGDKDE